MSTARMEMKNENTKQLASNQASPLFFNQKPQASNSPDIPLPTELEEQPPPEQLILQSTTDILLAAILKELKTHSMIELMKLKVKQEQEQEKLTAAEEVKEREDAHFEELRNSMYM